MSSEANGAMPSGWALARIGDLIGRGGVFVDGDWVESKDQNPNGDIRLIQLADIGDGIFRDRSARFLTWAKAQELGCTFLQQGDLLIARMPDPLGRACVFPGDRRKAVTAVDVCIVRTGSSTVSHRWLMWTINAPEFRSRIAELQSGSTRKRISRSNLATLSLPLPPLPEQHRIVAEIEKHFTRLDAAAAALERVQANLKRYRAAVLKAACEGRLVPTETGLAHAEGRTYEPAVKLLARILNERRARWEADQLAKMQAKGKVLEDEEWKTKYKGPTPPDVTKLYKLPVGWCWTIVQQLTPSDRPTAYGVLQPGPDVPDGIPLVRVGDIDNGRVSSLTALKRIAPAIAAGYPRTKLQGEEVLITLVGAIGRTAVVPASLRGANTARAVGVIPLSARVSAAWVELWFRNPDQVQEMTGKAHEVARKTLNLEDVRNAPVALAPLAEQQRIVAEVERRLSVIDELDAVVDANLKRAERLRQAILKRAFEGKLVPQDPNDEPASVLLERIRAERAATTAGNAGGQGSRRAPTRRNSTRAAHALRHDHQ